MNPISKKSSLSVPSSKISAIFIDEEEKTQLIFTKDQLINQLRRECPKISKSFDFLYSTEFQQLSDAISGILPIIYVGNRDALKQNDQLITTCGNLLRNSSNTVIASIQTLRSGFRLQSGILLRSVIEICATVVHLLVQPKILNDFLTDKITSSKSISVADKQIPLFGRLWGELSKRQIHINSIHSDWYPLREFKDKEEVPAKVTLGMISVSVLILEIVTELVFINLIEKPKHWEVIDKGVVQFIPPDSSQLSQIEYLFKATDE